MHAKHGRFGGRILVVAAVVGAATTALPAQTANREAVASDVEAGPIAAAVQSYNRFPGDRWADPDLKPLAMGEFLELKPGERVVEFMPGATLGETPVGYQPPMYWVRLFHEVAGPQGKVYSFIPQIGCRPTRGDSCAIGNPYSTSIGYKPEFRPKETLLGNSRLNGIDQSLALQHTSAFSDLSTLWVVAGQFSVPEQIDSIFSFADYHRLHGIEYQVPMAEQLRNMLQSLKPGGRLVIADYSAAPGAGFSVVDTLHRVDRDAVKREVEAAGFIFDGDSDMYANPADSRATRVTEESTTRRGVDMFVLKFRKPADALSPTRPTDAQMAPWVANTTYDYASTKPGAYKPGIWYNADHTYQEYRGPEGYIGKWFFDAAGHICLWHEFPARVNGLVGCHPWVPKKAGDVWEEDINQGRAAQVTLRADRTYPILGAIDDRTTHPPDASAELNEGYAAARPYWGNSLVFREDGKVIAIINYAAGQSYREWRRGRWVEGSYTINNAQGSTTICTTREQDHAPLSNCHPFLGDRKVGDSWNNPERPEQEITLEQGLVTPPDTASQPK